MPLASICLTSLVEWGKTQEDSGSACVRSYLPGLGANIGGCLHQRRSARFTPSPTDIGARECSSEMAIEDQREASLCCAVHFLIRISLSFSINIIT